MMSVPVTSVGIRSGVNWMRLNVSPSASRGAHEQSLRGARHAGDQAVAADEQREQQVLDDLVLADDDLADLDADPLERSVEILDQCPGLFRLELVRCFVQRTISNNNCWASL